MVLWRQRGTGEQGSRRAGGREGSRNENGEFLDVELSRRGKVVEESSVGGGASGERFGMTTVMKLSSRELSFEVFFEEEW